MSLAEAVELRPLPQPLRVPRLHRVVRVLRNVRSLNLAPKNPSVKFPGMLAHLEELVLLLELLAQRLVLHAQVEVEPKHVLRVLRRPFGALGRSITILWRIDHS